MPDELVSVIIPVYNAEKYLEACVESVCAQTYKNLEIILVDDCSPDGSGALCDTLAARDGRIKVVHKKTNGGVSAARNTAIELASGSFFMFLDADDWLDTNACEVVLSAVVDNRADSAVWNYISEYGESSKKKCLFEQTKLLSGEEYSRFFRRVIAPTNEQLNHPEFLNSLGILWNKIFRAQIIRENNLRFIDLQVIGVEDLMFCVEFFSKASNCVCMNGYYYHYRRATGVSLTSGCRPQLFESFKNLYSQLDRVCSERADSAECADAVASRRVLSIIGLGFNELRRDASLNSKLRRIREFLSDPETHAAAKKLPMNYFPLHWKVFFLCVKFRCALCVFILLKAMRMIISKRD